ncbi:MAG: flavoprotein [Propionibacteriaceae bacterium]|jgi:hypothetical protein|nr:flavoprotein [Propionibacteriaceae bacterium]
MNETELRRIIEIVIAAVNEVLHPKRTLVLFTGALLGFEDSLAALSRLQGAVELELVQTPSAKRVLDQGKIAALGIPEAGEHLIANHDQLVIPTLTANTAAKAAYNMADSLATNLISEFLMTGKRVVAAATAADPDSPDKRQWFPLMPPGQAAVLRENLARLKSMGVELCEARELDAAVTGRPPTPCCAASSRPENCCAPRPTKSLLSAAEVQTFAPGSTLVVSSGTIVTQAARDLAATKHITIERR